MARARLCSAVMWRVCSSDSGVGGGGTAAALHSLKMIGLWQQQHLRLFNRTAPDAITLHNERRCFAYVSQSVTCDPSLSLYTLTKKKWRKKKKKKKKKKRSFFWGCIQTRVIILNERIFDPRAAAAAAARREVLFSLFLSFTSFSNVIDWSSISRLPRSWERERERPNYSRVLPPSPLYPHPIALRPRRRTTTAIIE